MKELKERKDTDMAYTALEKMRINNLAAYGKDVGPAQPVLFAGGLERTDLKSAALRFIHERCEGLRFDADVTKIEKKYSEGVCKYKIFLLTFR